MSLTDKQQRFCEEYMIDLNATQAAIRAGYSKKTANEIGCQNLAKLNIQEKISELKNEISERNRITVDECVGMLADMARFDLADIYDENGNLKPIQNIPEKTRLAIESLDSEEHRDKGLLISTTKKVKISSRRENIKELMKYLGGYKEDNSQKQPVLVMQSNPLADGAEGDNSGEED